MNSKDILKDLIKFNTVKDKQNKEIIDYIEKYLKQNGFETEYKSKCLIMKNKDKSKYNLGFLGHTDTVLPNSDWTKEPFQLQEENGKLYGLGTCDMKGGISSILEVVSKIDWNKLNSGIKLYFTYDEEINFKGIKEIVARKEKFPKYMIIGEPTNNEIMNGSKGLLEFKFKFNGVSTHSSMPQKGINAIEKCIEFIQELKEFYNKLKNEKSDNFEIGYTTMNIGKICGGESINIVPNNCEVLIDFRTIKKEHTKLIINKIDDIIQNYDGEYEIINCIDAFMNKKESINSTNFITEASFINSSKRYILGVGPINPHETDEYITIESLEKLCMQYEKMIYKYCK